jgi:hypothetical protein
MTDRPKLLPALICGQIAMYGGAKAGIAIGSLFGLPGALLGCYIGGFAAELYAVSRSFHSPDPYGDASKALLGLGVNMLPETPSAETVLTDPLPAVSGLPEASPLPAPAAARRPSLLERITAARQETAPS